MEGYGGGESRENYTMKIVMAFGFGNLLYIEKKFMI